MMLLNSIMIKELNIDLDHGKLLKTFYDLDLINLLDNDIRQISVQHRGIEVNKQLLDGCGSLMLDWSSYDPAIHNEVPRKENENIPKETEFNLTCDLFKGSYIEEIIDVLQKQYHVHRGRFMRMMPKTCLTTHRDNSHRIHIPIITNNDCYMIISDRVYRMAVRKVYLANTKLPHTAVNSSLKNRYHLVFCTELDFFKN